MLLKFFISVKWRRQNREIKNSEIFTIQQTDEDYVLKINNTNMIHKGSYLFSAVNDHGEANCEIILDVLSNFPNILIYLCFRKITFFKKNLKCF